MKRKCERPGKSERDKEIGERGSVRRDRGRRDKKIGRERVGKERERKGGEKMQMRKGR